LKSFPRVPSFLVLLLASFTGFVVPLKAGPVVDTNAATLVRDFRGGRILFQQGAVDERHSPCSSFKIPIALMGFDAGVLRGPHEPRIDYRPEFQAGREADKIPVDPSSWLRNSVVWYSQQTTLKLGKERFEKYLRAFRYGNGDATGHPGKGDGLTQSWLMSSLQISPREQVGFLFDFLEHRLPVSQKAAGLALETIPTYPGEGGWEVHGKSGAGYLTARDGTVTLDRPLGWFVGWAEKGPRRVVFARFEAGAEKAGLIYGGRCRSAVCSNLVLWAGAPSEP